MRATNNLRRVLAIDPGYDRLGIAVVEGTSSKQSVLWSDCVSPAKGTGSERLAEVAEAVRDALTTYSPHALAIETLFFSKNKKTALLVAEARGAILAIAGMAHIPVIEFSPQQIKSAVTGYGNADKIAVGRMVAQLVSLPKKKRVDDELDAIAIGITALATGVRS